MKFEEQRYKYVGIYYLPCPERSLLCEVVYPLSYLDPLPKEIGFKHRHDISYVPSNRDSLYL
jgi:hypothetical protein